MKMIGLLLLLVFNVSGNSQSMDEQINLLIFSKTNGYRHQSIKNGIQMFKKLAETNPFGLYFTEDSTLFDLPVNDSMDVIVFLNNSGDVLNEKQQHHVEQFIQNGGGYVGIHSASACEYEWQWYGNLVGTFFSDHPKIQPARILFEKTKWPCFNAPADTMTITDEWYNYRTPVPGDVQVLIRLDESSYEGGKMGTNHPVCWYHEYDGGRAFYTALGHVPELYETKFFTDHITCGVLWAAGKTDFPEK